MTAHEFPESVVIDSNAVPIGWALLIGVIDTGNAFDPFYSPHIGYRSERMHQQQTRLDTIQLSRRYPQLLSWLSIGRLNTTNKNSLIPLSRLYLPAKR